MNLNADHVIRAGIEAQGRAQREAEALEHYERYNDCVYDGPSVIHSTPLDTYALYEEAQARRAMKEKTENDKIETAPQIGSLSDLVVPFKRGESSDVGVGF